MKLNINKKIASRIWINGQLLINSDSPVWTGSDGNDLYMLVKNPNDGTEIKVHLIGYTEDKSTENKTSENKSDVTKSNKGKIDKEKEIDTKSEVTSE